VAGHDRERTEGELDRDDGRERRADRGEASGAAERMAVAEERSWSVCP
jgi:hypothetical protein